MTIEAHNSPTEKDLAADLETRLGALAEAGRCDWRKEVRMHCWVQSSRVTPSALRIDYAAKLDGVLIGFEVKRPPEKAADLGRYLVQCAQYAQGQIAPATVDRIPQEWTGQAVLGVFLVSDATHCTPYVQQHGLHAHRLFGPANVGFLKRRCRHPDCFELFLSADRVWSKEHGWNRGVSSRNHRIGNGSAHLVDMSEMTVPDDTPDWQGDASAAG